MPKSFESWSPCLKHDWEPIEGMRGLFRCKSPRCLVKGFQLEATSPTSQVVRHQKIRAYTCSSSGCSNPTLEKSEPCPACKNKNVNNKSTPSNLKWFSMTAKQQEALKLLQESEDPIQCEQSMSRVFETLHEKGLANKKQVVIWSLSKKGEKFMEEE